MTILRPLNLAAVSLLALTLINATPVDAVGNQPGSSGPKKVIVVLKDSQRDAPAAAQDISARSGVVPEQVYENALKGFATTASDEALGKLKADPRVAFVSEDREVHAMAQTTPSGVSRIGDLLSPTARIEGISQRMPVDVAVLDTGVDTRHRDLKVVGGKSCLGSGYQDVNGHGTHVAGTIGALDNGRGVVGVAPGARLWSVRVLDKRGTGSWSSVICGIDWVTAHKDTIRVANLSLGGVGSDDSNCGATNSDALHRAICRSAQAGVTYVAAAGNGDGSGQPLDVAGTVPAAYDEVIAVSALADSDGQPGGLGRPTSYGADDTFADFSNYASSADLGHLLAAPGVQILSTLRGGGYGYMTGTSMASPHVAGAAALYRVRHPSATPAEVLTGLRGSAEVLGTAHTDPDGRHPEPVLLASSF